MLEKRQQGRPKYGEAQVGRDRIISGTVAMVRSGFQGDMSRKKIASYVGITPALITYYFPKGELLLIDSFSDVFVPWYEEFEAILSGPGDYDERLTAAFRLILALYKREYHVELLYADLCRKGILGPSIIEQMKVRLIAFLDEDPSLAGEETSTSEILANIIWGACLQCARLDHSDAVYEIVGRFAGSRFSEEQASSRRRSSMRSNARRSRNDVPSVPTILQRQPCFSSIHTDARDEASPPS